MAIYNPNAPLETDKDFNKHQRKIQDADWPSDDHRMKALGDLDKRWAGNFDSKSADRSNKIKQMDTRTKEDHNNIDSSPNVSRLFRNNGKMPGRRNGDYD